MTFLGLERPVEYGRQQIFDPTTANMVLNAQQNYINEVKNEYLRGLADLKEFNKEYGDFVTPILADQDWYNKNVTGKVRDFINNAYEQGIDLLRSPEGRLALSQLQNSINVGNIAKLRSSRDAANKYLEARGALEAAGKYNADLEERFLGYNLNNWDTLGGSGIWSRTSPTEMKTLKELTENWYNSRTARDLTKADLEAAGIPYDPRYQYSGYLDSDILNVARGNTPGWNDSVYSQYYRDLAKRQLNAVGVDNPTQAQVESVLQRNIADANQEWLINPVKRADEFATMRQQFNNQMALQKDAQAFQERMQDKAAQDKINQIVAKAAAGGGSGKSNPNSSNYSLTESVHHDLLFQGLRNSNIPIMRLTKDDKGNVVPKKNSKGEYEYVNPDNASWDELEYAANHKNHYLFAQQKFFAENSKKYTPEQTERRMMDTFGGRITAHQFASMLERNRDKDGGIYISLAEAKRLRGTKGITSDGLGSTYGLKYTERLAEVYDKINKIINEGKIDGSTILNPQIKFNLTDVGNNAVQISEKYNKGQTEIYGKGTVTIVGKDTTGKPISHVVDTNVYLPTGVNSEKAAGNHKNVKSNLALSGANQSAYASMDAHYMKQMGSQKNANVGLFANSGIPMMIDTDNLDVEDLLEVLKNNPQILQ